MLLSHHYRPFNTIYAQTNCSTTHTMVSPSKKKKKVTVVAMKKSRQKRSSALSPIQSHPSRNNTKHHRRSSLPPSHMAKSAAISHPLSTKIYLPLTNASFFSSARLRFKGSTDMVSELSKNTLDGFELNCENKINVDSSRRSARLIDTRDDEIVEVSTINHNSSLDRITSSSCVNASC